MRAHDLKRWSTPVLLLGLVMFLCFPSQPSMAEEKGSSLYSPYASETFDYPDVTGSFLPLNNPDYGNWTYDGENKPVAKISGKDSRGYVELLRDPSKATGFLSKPVSIEAPGRLYFEVNMKLPNARTGKSEEDVQIGLYQGDVNGHRFGGLKVAGTDPYFAYDAGSEVTAAKDLSGQPIAVDPTKWYKVIFYMNFAQDVGAYHIRILQEGLEIFDKANIPLNLSGKDLGNRIDYISFMNSSPANAVYIDDVLLRNGMAVNEDFQAYALGTVSGEGWTPIRSNGNVKLEYASEGDNRFIQMTNPSNGDAINTRLNFLHRGLDLTTDQTVVEFDFKGSKPGRKEIRLMKSDFGFTSVRMTMSNGTIYLQTTGKEGIPVVSGKNYDENKWYHFTFVINFTGRFYDFYLDHSTEPVLSGVNFYTSDSMEDGYLAKPDSSKNVGLLYLSSEKSSGTFALDNIKIYPQERPAYGDLSSNDIPKLRQVLSSSTDKSEKSEALYKLKQIGTTDILPSLEIALGDNQRGVRLVAARILGHFGNEINEKLLGMLLDPSSNYFSREAVINQLVVNGQSRQDIAAKIGSSFRKGDPVVRKAAATVLGELRSNAKGVVPALLAELQNERNDLQTRLTILDALWNIDEKSIPVSSWTIALYPEAEPYYQLMNKAHEVLLNAGREAVPALRNTLASSDKQIKARAASLLGDIGPEAAAAVGDLIQALKDDAWYVRWEARNALSQMASQIPGAKAALAAAPKEEAPAVPKLPVTLVQADGKAIVDNGVISVEIGTEKQFGSVISFMKDGDKINLYNNNGQYWTSNGQNYGSSHGNAPAPKFEVIKNTPEAVELSFKTFAGDSRPYSLDIRYVVRSGEVGYHYYAIEGKDPAYPDAYVGQIATKLRVNPSLFDYRIFADGLQGQMITPEQLDASYESEIMNETYRLPNGDIWAKYGWKNYDLPTRGAFGFLGDQRGIWVVLPAADSGGNTILDHFGAGHETTDEPVLIHNLEEGFFVDEPMYVAADKVLGPYFVYANSGANATEMWVDAKRKAEGKQAVWPYDWVTDPAYAKERGTVTGKLVDAKGAPVPNANIILCYPDPNTDYSWQHPFGSNYYSTRTMRDGSFAIPKAAPGNYSLFAFVDGVYGELRKDGVIVQASRSTDVGTWNLVPKTSGDLVWQIGVPDRSVKEFKGGNNPRVFDKFLRYSEFFPNDVNYTVGKSEPGEDFFFWQPAQTMDGRRPVYNIQFEMAKVPQGKAVLTLGFASTRGDTQLEAAINGSVIDKIPFTYEADGGAMLRGAPYGISRQRVLYFDASLLKPGSNTLTLKLTKGDWLNYAAYDFLRLETSSGNAPDPFSDMKTRWAEADGASGTGYDPDAKVSRAEWVEMVTRAAGLKHSIYLGAYRDVLGDEWYAGAIQSGRYKQLIPSEMTPGNDFLPQAHLTREELASLAMKAYEYRLGSLPSYDLSKLSDGGSIDKWARRYVQAGMATGIVKGQSDNAFAPQEEVTRAEALETVRRLMASFPWLPPIVPSDRTMTSEQVHGQNDRKPAKD